MTRKEIIDELSGTLDIGKKTCGEMITAIQDEIVDTLSKGGRYMQTGFGSFSTSISNERVGRHPITGQKMRFPKKRKMKFKPSTSLKDNINE